MTTYDEHNPFAKILKGELPCDKVYEDEFALAFHDLTPQAPVHVLVIPKGPYANLNDMASHAGSEFVGGFFKAVAETAKKLNVVVDGYRTLINNGYDAHQEVKHLHVHILAGRKLGPMLAKQEG